MLPLDRHAALEHIIRKAAGMNYAQARQVDPKSDRLDAGKWRWTVRNDGRIWPSGYCSPIDPCPVGHELMEQFREGFECSTCNNTGTVRKAEPCPGHDTAEEAAEHYRQYEIDRHEFVHVHDEEADALHKCEVCGVFTASYMIIKGEGYARWTVCPGDFKRSTAEQLIQRHSSVMYS